MIGRDLKEQIVDEVKAIESRRVLLGYLSRFQALNYLMDSYRLRNPFDPTLSEEEVEDENEELRQEHLEQWQDARTSKNENPPTWISGEVELERFPDDSEIDSYISDFKSQDHFEQLVRDLEDDDWGLRLVPIRPLVAFQPTVALEGHSEVPTTDDDELIDVIKYCLPIRGRKYLMKNTFQYDDRLGFELVSRGPNIDVAEANFERDEESDTISVSFTVKPRVNIVQVVYYENRYILKNGYHRCFQLLDSGIDKVPAFVRNVGKFEETGADQPGMFGRDTILDARPPLIDDFFSEAAVDLDFPAHNKVIRFTAETNNVRR